MGNLVWNEYARYVSITASIYTIWGAFWGLFYRKFFWDFIGGTLRAPGGLQPSPNVAFFITITVKIPLLQIFGLLIGLSILALDYPLPFLKGTMLQRSLIVRVVALFAQAFNAILFYQGTNGAIWSLIAMGCYGRAIALGETMAVAKDNRGKGGRA